jgi:small-conductance mechanosensitive channel
VPLMQNIMSSGSFLWLGQRILGVIVTVAMARLLLRFGAVLIDRVLEPPPQLKGRYLQEKRSKTLNSLLKSVLRYFVYFIAILVILDIFELPTASILASAGIAGLAVGFGAQNLVRDVITGFFLIFEDQFSVGDYISAGGAEGIVEGIGFRVTKIRDFGGQLHFIPNGVIDKVSNFSTGNMRVLLDIRISYRTDIDYAITVLNDECGKIAAANERIVEGPKVLGVQELADSGVKLLIWAKAEPMEQWGVTREIRRRLKERLDQEGIEIPYPHTIVITRSGFQSGGVGNKGE